MQPCLRLRRFRLEQKGFGAVCNGILFSIEKVHALSEGGGGATVCLLPGLLKTLLGKFSAKESIVSGSGYEDHAVKFDL